VLALGLLGMFGDVLVYLALPIAVQEMVMAVWLIVKGFNPPAIASSSDKTDKNEINDLIKVN
jgi:hypothetical protein